MSGITNLISKLSDSERKLLVRGSVIVFLALFWAFVYKPINQSIESKEKHLTELESQFSEMQSSQGLLRKTVNSAKTRDLSKPFISWVDGQLLSSGLSDYVSRSEPKDNQTLILTFENVAFDELISWLQPMISQYSINVSEADINLTDKTNGRCNVRITLEEKI